MYSWNHYLAWFGLSILLFLTIWSHCHILLEINYSLTVENNPLVTGKLDFNFIKCITISWDSKAYVIAILVAFFSGVMPYLKILSLSCNFEQLGQWPSTTPSTSLRPEM